MLALLGVAIWWWLGRQGSGNEIRHVILISLDTTRADHISCYGFDQNTTPCIDSLAAEGVQFQHTMTPVPLTLPAHASMLTGLIPPTHGKRKNGDVYFDPAHVTLGMLLKEQGYRTGAFIGAQVLNSSFGLDRGFDTYQDEFAQAERLAEQVNEAAFSWLDQQQDASVFMFIHYYDPHDEYEPPEPFASQFENDPYAGEIAYSDHCISQIMDQLKQRGMYDSSLIIVTGDHGEMLGEHGEDTHMFFIYQSALKVPLVIRAPGATFSGRVDDLASIIDIVPTVCGLLNIQPPDNVQGTDLSGYLMGEPPAPEERYLYCESMHPTHYGANPLLGLASLDWKYIFTTRPELYDLQKDPGELENLITREERRANILKENLNQIAKQAASAGNEQQEAPIDPKLLRQLQSLGYIGGSSAQADLSFDETREDPKDIIDYHNAWHKAEHLVIEQEFDEALQVIQEAVKKRPGYVLYELGTRICMRQKQWTQAIDFGQRALELRPEDIPALQNLAAAFSQSGQDDEAARYWERSLEFMTEPAMLNDRIRTHFQIGMTRLRQEKHEAAIRQFESALALQPKQPRILDRLANLLLTCPDRSLRNPTRALDLAKQACALTQSQQAGMIKTLAIAFAENNDFANASKAAQQALIVAKTRGDQNLARQLQQYMDQFNARQNVID